MTFRFILTDYVSQLLAHAVYDKLDDSMYAGRISQCRGVVVFGATLRECEDELHSTLEDWLILMDSVVFKRCRKRLIHPLRLRVLAFL
ncbi:MAG: hypothetical protein C5S47_06655 [Candidatus Methanogasteraceae archaeon]|nr:MAG: hypothetical protein C5S47_06655 [ANME-2 cluster archaeon]